RTGSRRMGLVEALEDQRKLFRRNARPAVGHLDAALDTVGAGPHPDIAAAVLNRVLHQVGQYALDPARIADQCERLALNGDPVLPAPRADQPRHDRLDVDKLLLHRFGPGIEPGDLHQLTDQRPEPAHIGDEQLDWAASRIRQLAYLVAEQ